MLQTTNRTFICSVVFLDIVECTKNPVNEQIQLKSRFNAILAEAIKDVAVNDRIILDTGDGAAIGFLGDPEDALFVALSIRDAIIGEDISLKPLLSARTGINLGPVKLVRDINGQPNLIGDGINVAQRVMSFAEPGQVLVSRSYFEVISRLSQEYAKLFHYEGSRADKHVREHQVYSVYPAEKKEVSPPFPNMRRPEEQSNRTAGNDLSTSATDFDTSAKSGGAVMPEDDESHRTSQQTFWHLGWKKMLTNWSMKWLNRDTLQSKRIMLCVAVALIVILISVPVIVWKTEGTPAKDQRMIRSPVSVAKPEEAKKAGLPAAGAKAETTALDKAVDNIPASITVSIGIAPWGEVYVDGKKKGVSPPLNSLKLAPGKHQIEIRNTTFPPYKQIVDLKPGNRLKIKHIFR